MKCKCCNVYYSLEDVTAMVDEKNALVRRVAELEEAAVCKHQIVQWVPQPGAFYRLCCATCGIPFPDECFVPSGPNMFMR